MAFRRLSAISLFCFLFCLALAATPVAVALEVGACQPDPVYVIDNIGCVISAGRITITAEGRTRTSGWSSHILNVIAKSDDGQSARLAFLSCPPKGITMQALWKAAASLEVGVDALPALKTVTATSETNEETTRCRHLSPQAPKPLNHE